MSLAISFTTLTILIRSIYRLIELQQGFDGSLANNETDFMVLEGPMVFIGVTLLTIWHPGYVLGTKLWNEANFHLRSKRGAKREMEKLAGGSAGSSMDGIAMSAPRETV
jgi:hypothetical protein